MSERKVLSKYYPPDFDPSLVGRTRKPKSAANTPKVQVVRLMAPFSMRCTACGEYMYRGRKFNARKETRPDEKYLSIQIYRFYIRCTRCSAEIVFKTDPKNQDYLVEQGAKRNTDPWKRGLEDGEVPGEDETDEQRLDRLERAMAEAAGEEEKNAMAELEQKTEDAKREMAVADALDEIRSRNARLEKAKSEGVDLLEGVVNKETEEERERRRQEEEDAEAARRAFQFARRQEMLEEIVEEPEEEVNGSNGGSSSSSSSVVKSAVTAATTTTATDTTDMPPPSFKRVVKRKKDHSALLGIKKKKVA
ncbi:CWC16 protein [Cercophora samala]|uniref:Splicing factor YJU2 n=1 Tax=Cercophora samala TaxID=330535 RepID=A0AA40DCH3_9PEZI|nr:CWC16 protein [Cercophora samala]